MSLLKINEEIDFSSLLNPSCKSEVRGDKKCRFYYLFIQNISLSPEDPIATGTLSAILDFSTDFLPTDGL